MKLSILIPIYNVSEYLEECLESVLQLKDSIDYEVICINDGSTDNSLEIINCYAEKNNRFIVIDKENSGYGDSLNRGIEVATGDYIYFLESDDILIAYNLLKLCTIAEYTNVNVVKGNYNLYFSSDEKTYYDNFLGMPYNVVFCPRENWKVMLSAPAIWSGIYKKQFLIDYHISFLPTKGASYQDSSYMFKIWCATQNAILLNEPIVNYRQNNENSSSNSNKKVFNIFAETVEMKSYLSICGWQDLFPLCMRVKYQSFAWNLSRLAGGDRIAFIVKMHYDIRQDFYEGLLQKQYWELDNWNIVYNLIADWRKVLDEVSISPHLKHDSVVGYLENIFFLSDNGKDCINGLAEFENVILVSLIEEKLVSNDDNSVISDNCLVLIDEHSNRLLEYIGWFEKNYKYNYLVV